MYWALLLAETRTFLEIVQAEWLGAVASLFVLFSFLTRNQTKIRLINMIGCAIFVVYGILLPSYSTGLLNAALLVVHTVYLVKDFKNKKKEKSEQPQVANEQAPLSNATDKTDE